jgi:hypothetical protein
MKTSEFNQSYEIDRKAKGVKAMPKHSRIELPEILTADGTAYDANETYHFFDLQMQEIRQSLGLRRDGDFLASFGLRVVAVSNLRASLDGALADDQLFFALEIERLQDRIQEFELERRNQ